jgi:predicted O-methyltransferase YrrM
VRTDLREKTRKTLERLFRGQLQPPLGTIARGVSESSTAEDDILRSVFPGIDPTQFNVELGSLDKNRGVPASQAARAYPALFAMGDVQLRLLYKMMRLAKPNRVVETGVADGASSQMILRALSLNGAGQLTSYDVADDVGSLVDPALRAGWELVVLPGPGRAEAFREHLVGRAPIDVFIHDSNHSYAWQSLEYRLGYDALRPGGLLVSDDIDGSFAFLDFVSRLSLRSFACVGPRKAMGIAVKPLQAIARQPAR